MIKCLKKSDYVVCAYAEPASGPGWANSPIWLIVMDQNHKLRQECIQPDDQTADMRLLYSISAQVHSTMLKMVRDLRKK